MREARRCPRCTVGWLLLRKPVGPTAKSRLAIVCGHVQYHDTPPDLSTPFTERVDLLDGRIQRPAQADWEAIKADAEQAKTAATF